MCVCDRECFTARTPGCADRQSVMRQGQTPLSQLDTGMVNFSSRGGGSGEAVWLLAAPHTPFFDLVFSDHTSPQTPTLSPKF